MNEFTSDVDAIVVGSGFGGAVAAARLAQAGRSVTVFERGRRWQPGSFPRRPDLRDGWLWAHGDGLYDLRWLDRMMSIQAAGWGGGSLIYANVFARPPADAFAAPAWPATIRRDTLDPYYDLAAHMLEVRPMAADPLTGRAPGRTVAIGELARRTSRPAGTVRPNLAVRFDGDLRHPQPNRHGVPQRSCAFCGECVIGCNRGAKNTLDLNYLAIAERHGATAVTGTEVVRLERDDDRWLVTARDRRSGAEHVHRGRTVFLAAGAVGTTELLLRQRDVLGTLPRLSRRLGEHFSGNGDALAFVRRSRTPLEADRGPTITTTTVVDVDELGDRVWFQVQDGAIPSALVDVIQAQVRAAVPRTLRGRCHPSRTASGSGAHGAGDTMALLMMGRDASTGRLSLDRRGEAAVAWSNRANRALYRAQGRIGRYVATHLRARAAALPAWALLRRPVTVHNLGGVPIGPDAVRGVVDEYGAVHGHAGLFVVDGAIVPAATGVNPSATILAMAERNVEHAVHAMTGDRQWRAPEWADVRPAAVPEDAAFAEMARRRRERHGDGVRFVECLTGSVDVAGRRRRARLRVDAAIPGWTAFRADPEHAVELRARLDIVGVLRDHPLRGTLRVFPERDADRALMRYTLESEVAGMRVRLVGTKHAIGRGPLRLVARWRSLTTLHVELGGIGEPEASGTLQITLPAALRLAASLRGAAFTTPRRVRAAARFAGWFAARSLRPAP